MLPDNALCTSYQTRFFYVQSGCRGEGRVLSAAAVAKDRKTENHRDPESTTGNNFWLWYWRLRWEGNQDIQASFPLWVLHFCPASSACPGMAQVCLAHHSLY